MNRLSRRGVLVGGLAVAGLAACSQKPVLADPAEPVPPLYDRIQALQRRYNTKIGVYAVDFASGRTVSHLDGEPFAMCSTFKGYAAARVLQMVGNGDLTLDQQVFVDPTWAALPNSPRTAPNSGDRMTLGALCAAAVQVSDNCAGNLLLQTIGGPSAITGFARSIGDDRTRLDRWEIELNSAIPGDPRDTSTPHALGDGYRTLLTGDALPPPQRQQLEDWMRANETSSMLAGLPAGWTSADKTGNGDYGSTNDVGIAYGPAGQKLVLAIMTRSQGDDPNAPNNRPLIGEVASVLVPWLREN
ncbi:class A beta-lactamase [Mycobacterium sp. ITM-2016-00318]|uniref:class A beta-lactamase n=1 Tax=Mycobacterium sp. ITM-2016-00318 TaxID=2099693 RepID=UPI000CF8F436|nr:class A beta-lactamase [Mycobacterium sp. ITM-2016-00318]WNG94861.1 class A beta-lactamase [Mycobacterium sp. ITM-2016-00318]